MIENAAGDDKIEACLCVSQETFKISKQKARLIEIKKNSIITRHFRRQIAFASVAVMEAGSSFAV
jgi:adenine deaminase